MGCAPSKEGPGSVDSRGQDSKTAQAAGGAGPSPGPRSRLNKALSEKARYPSAIPGSFFDREARFREEQQPVLRKAVKERHEGLCKMRAGAWGAWKEGCCTLTGHQLRIYSGVGVPPPLGAQPERSLELVGAHLKLEGKQEAVLAPAGGGPAVALSFPDERQRDEWMAGLGSVPGLFRRVRDYYELGASWGHGATCVVHECAGRYSGRRYALKSRVHKSREATEAMHNELRILQICAKKPHPAIPRLHDYFFDDDGSIELVMDLMQGGELFDHIATVDQLREHEARDIFKQVAEGVAHLHSLGIAHRDLKPQNLMYVSADEGAQVKIMDYDLAKVNYAPTWEGHTPCGTIHYMAPEVVQHRKYSLGVDMWSLGVILFILLTGHVPFDGRDDESIAAAIEAGQYSMDPKLWGEVSGEARDLVRCLLQTDPEKRPTAEQVLAHPWLNACLEQRPAVALASPVQLRSSLSKTERGRTLLALAALAHSEGDLRLKGSGEASSAAVSRALASARTLPAPRLNVLSSAALDFDMQAVRDQSQGPRAAAAAAAVNGGGASKAHSRAGGADHNDSALALLRSQLATIGTAGGLQDRQALEAQGVQLLGGSPRGQQTAEGPAAASSQQQQQQAAAAAQGGLPARLPAVDSFADLDALEVEETELPGGQPGSAGRSRRGSFSGGGGGFGSALMLSPRWSPAVLSRAASTLRERPSQPDPLHLPPLPPRQALPGDQQLLERLGSRQAGAGLPAAAAAAGSHRGSLDAAGSCGLLTKSTSTSRLNHKDARLAEEEREPVDLAMAHKRERLRRLRTAPTLYDGGSGVQ